MSKSPIFVIQKHFASHLHYDFRIEIGGVLKSWAVPKGVSQTVGEKRLAIQTSDHALSYAVFEGEIPQNQYGAGKVILWDRGFYHSLKKEESLQESYEKGRMEINLMGKKISGNFALIHLKEKKWILIKMKPFSS